MVTSVFHRFPSPFFRGLSPNPEQKLQKWIGAGPALFFTAHPKPFGQTRRCFTSSSIKVEDTLKTQLAGQIDVYQDFLKFSNQRKVDTVFQQGLIDSLAKFGIRTNVKTPLRDSWQQLVECLGKHDETLPPFHPQDTQENVFNLFRFPRPLLTDEGLRFSRQSKDYITTVTEFYWTLIFPNIAFTRASDYPLLTREHVTSIFNQVSTSFPSWKPHSSEQQVFDQMVYSSEEDALVAILLAIPYIREDTLVHELGCWSGENLTRLLYHTHLQGKVPLKCIGTDIHEIALNIGESTLNYLGIHNPHLQLHLANARYPLNFTSLNISYTHEVKMALKLIPVLEPNDAQQLLESARLSFRSPDSVLIISYPILKGAMYELNEKRSKADPTRFHRSPFDGGVVFKTPFEAPEILPPYLKKLHDQRVLINTYYSEEGFNNLAKASGFVVKQSISVGNYSDNYRIVSVLAQK